MKVIAKKIFYEMDLYQYPDENTSYGLFGLGGGFIKNAPRRKDPELVHKKGDFKEWKFETKEMCCTSMELAIEAERITFQDPERITEYVAVFIACACWPIQLMKINYCHFCGKKIEVEEKK